MTLLLGILYGTGMIVGSFIYNHYTNYQRLQEVRATYIGE
jgi:hypothetical protein